jgi:hypothetical protein
VSADGCRVHTATPVFMDDGVASIAGPVAVDGCGVSLDATRAKFYLRDSRAELEGPVHTRLEARK